MGGIHVILSCEIFCILEEDLGFQIGEIRINEMTSFWKLTSTSIGPRHANNSSIATKKNKILFIFTKRLLRHV